MVATCSSCSGSVMSRSSAFERLLVVGVEVEHLTIGVDRRRHFAELVLAQRRQAHQQRDLFVLVVGELQLPRQVVGQRTPLLAAQVQAVERLERLDVGAVGAEHFLVRRDRLVDVAEHLFPQIRHAEVDLLARRRVVRQLDLLADRPRAAPASARCACRAARAPRSPSDRRDRSPARAGSTRSPSPASPASRRTPRRP
jgi:hypothetical protein